MMIKYSYLLLILTLGTVTLKGFNANAQEFADKSYYLVDSLVLQDFSKQDLEIMEKYLAEFHATDDDTVKIRAIDNLINEMTNDHWAKYNELQYNLCYQVLKQDLSPEKRKLYSAALSTSISNQGFLYDIEGKTELAIEKYKESFTVSFQVTDSLGIATALNNLGASYYQMADFKTAIAYYNEALKIVQELDMDEDRGIILNNLGMLYRDMGDFKTSLEFLKESLALHDALGMKKDVALTCNNIGYIYLIHQDYDKASKYFSKALELSIQIGLELGKAQSCTGLADCYREIGQFDTAEKYYKSSLKIYGTIGNIEKIQCEKRLGELYRLMGRYKESQQILMEALNIADEANYQLDMIEIRNSLSKSSLSSGDVEKAILYGTKSLEMAKDLGLPRLERDALLQLSECYKSSKEYDKGQEAYTKYVILNDSIQNNEIQNKPLVEEADYLLDVKDREAALLEERAKLKDHLLFGIIGFVALIIVSILVGYYFVKKRRAKNENHQFLTRDFDFKNTSNESSFELALINANLSNPLSQRELNVLEELVKGNSNQEIADSLFISINTVKSHLIKIYAKLEVKNRTSAVQKIHDFKLNRNS